MCDRKWCACEKKSRPRGVSGEALKKLEVEYAKFTQTESSSLLKKHLTRNVFDNLKNRRTSYGSTLMDVIQSGLANPDSSMGIYAPDPEAYTVFADLFDPCIEEYHGGFGKDQSHPGLEWGDPADLGDLDPDGKYIVSTRVRCARSIKGYPLNPTMKEQHYTEIEEKVKEALATLNGELEGTYQSLGSMDKETQQRLIDEHFLFKEGDRFLEAANANNYWPLGRGIFFNEKKTFLVWCNEEDHLRVISMQKAGDLAAVYRRLVQAVSLLERKLSFARHERLGYLTFCPSNLGTTIRASVHAKLPKLSADYPQFQEIAESYGLQVRGTAGEHSEAEEGIYDISNRRRLGLTEWQVVEEMKNGIVEMIKQEESL